MKKSTTRAAGPATKPASAGVPGAIRTNTRKAGDATRERMLDAAEALFAKNGYHGTSMRDIADATDSRIALVTYHFGTKDVLFNKVVERRASYMAHQRILALDAARRRAGNDPIPLRDLISGYVLPFVERSAHGGQGWKNYSHLVARLSNSPDWAKVISDHYDAVARQFVAEFRRTLPTVPEEDVYHSFSFMIGSMVALVSEPGRVESLSLGKFKSTNLERAFDCMLPFLEGAFMALCNKR